MEESRYVADVHHLRLMSLLQELVRDNGGMKGAARVLGIDHRTVAGSMAEGELTKRAREALDHLLLAGGSSAAVRQREEMEALGQRIEALEKEVRRGFRAVEGGIEGLREEHVEDTRGIQRRLGLMETGRSVHGVEESPSLVRRPPVRVELRRENPELATLEPAEDDEEVFGEAWPLIVKWRGLKERHPSSGKGLAWLSDQEQLMEVELALLEEHGLTLPPETQPLRGLDRGAQVNWRRQALYDTGRARARAELRKLLTFGLWRT